MATNCRVSPTDDIKHSDANITNLRKNSLYYYCSTVLSWPFKRLSRSIEEPIESNDSHWVCFIEMFIYSLALKNKTYNIIDITHSLMY